jgi:hypothetical protein
VGDVDFDYEIRRRVNGNINVPHVLYAILDFADIVSLFALESALGFVIGSFAIAVGISERGLRLGSVNEPLVCRRTPGAVAHLRRTNGTCTSERRPRSSNP